MTSPTSKVRARWILCAALGVAAIMLLDAPRFADAQVVQGVEKGAREGSKAAGPVGGVLGGAIGGVVGVVTGVTGVLTGGNGGKAGQSPAAKESKQGDAAKESKQGDAAKPAKAARVARRKRPGRPPFLPRLATGAHGRQIVANSDANMNGSRSS